MFDYSIKINSLGKMYKLYKTNSDKYFDAFGLSRLKQINYQEFWALKNVNLNIVKGERLGIVGRNGAGKSTLLKCILGNINPTEGNVQVNGNMQAMLELGTGFHPEFTGVENIKVFLAYQRLSNKEILNKIDEIVEFAELGEFISQPLKTYSAGMYARLAFSAATSLTPNILIIDEVLGAGDAYFASKCVDKMKELTSRHGATVLFVSHDMSSVEMLCDRAIWFERGEVIHDSDTMTISKEYSKMVRERTANRLKLKNAASNENSKINSIDLREKKLQLIARFVADTGNISVSMAEFQNGANIIPLQIGHTQDVSIDYESFVLIDDAFSSWGPPLKNQDTTYREVVKKPSCSAVVYNLDGIFINEPVKIILEYNAIGGGRFEIFNGTEYVHISDILPTSGNWTRDVISVPSAVISSFLKSYRYLEADSIDPASDAPTILDEDETVCDKDLTFDIENKKIKITSIRFLDDKNNETAIIKTFEKFKIEINYECFGDIEVDVVVCIHRAGIIALQMISGIDNAQPYKLAGNEKGKFCIDIPSVYLGKGNYYVSVGIFPPINYNSMDTEKTAYILIDRKFEIAVLQPEDALIDLGMSRCNNHWNRIIME